MKAKILLFNFILIPQLLLTSTLNTGDAYSKSSMTTSTDGEFVVTQDNDVTAISNTGNKTDSESTGDSTAVSEMNINDGKVEGKLEVEVNGEKKEMNVDKPGNYKLELNSEGDVIATSEVKTSENVVKKESLLSKFLNFILSLFR